MAWWTGTKRQEGASKRGSSPSSAVAPNGTSTDHELIKGVQARNSRAFDALFVRYRPRLNRFLTNLLRRPPLVDEVLNDTMAIVWRKADSFAGASQVSTWIYGIAYRQGLAALRKLDEPVEAAPDDLAASDAASPENMLDRSYSAAALARAIETLSADHRAVVDLTYFHQLGYRDIAEIMGCPAETVKTRMFYARRKLRHALQGDATDWI